MGRSVVTRWERVGSFANAGTVMVGPFEKRWGGHIGQRVRGRRRGDRGKSSIQQLGLRRSRAVKITKRGGNNAAWSSLSAGEVSTQGPSWRATVSRDSGNEEEQRRLSSGKQPRGITGCLGATFRERRRGTSRLNARRSYPKIWGQKARIKGTKGIFLEFTQPISFTGARILPVGGVSCRALTTNTNKQLRAESISLA